MRISRIGLFTAVFVFLGGAVLFSQRDAAEVDFDSSKVSREIEIMKSIFTTALEIADREMDSNSGGRRSRSRLEWMSSERGSGRVEGLYLHGQGVVFTVSAPAVPFVDTNAMNDMERKLEALKEGDLNNLELLEAQMYLMRGQLEDTQQQMEAFHLLREGMFPELEALPEPPLPPNPPELGSDAPEVPAQSEAARKERLDRTRAHLEQMKVKMKTARQRLEEKSAQAKVTRERIIKELVQVVASHGDTLSQLSPEQFVNLVLRERAERFGWDEEKLSGSTVLSVKKGDILQYKSGAITFDEFRSRVLKY